MKKTLVLIGALMLCSLYSKAQGHEHGIGLRLGEPSGFTYKRYLSEYHAAEFILGRNYNLGANFYRRTFDNNNDFDNFTYISHDVEVSFSLQGRYLSHIDILEEHTNNLKAYYGVGALLGYNRVNYTVDNLQVAGFNPTEESRNNFDIGAEGIIGLEYTIYEAPVAIFGEMSLYTELADNPFRFRLLGAIGARYNFNN